MLISVLGPVAVDGNGSSLSPRDRVVLAALAMRRGEVVSSDLLADALWGESVPASYTKVIQGCVVRLRKLLGSAAIETRGDGYCLVVPSE
jgi:DNA-binding SARP family transcriptional activator